MTIQVKNSNLVYVKFKKLVISKMKENKTSSGLSWEAANAPYSLCVFILCPVITGPR